jgi:hypothetical protein
MVYRCAMLKKFPFALYYAYANGFVNVYTIFHCSLDPAKLDQRLP